MSDAKPEDADSDELDGMVAAEIAALKLRLAVDLYPQEWCRTLEIEAQMITIADEVDDLESARASRTELLAHLSNLLPLAHEHRGLRSRMGVPTNDLVRKIEKRIARYWRDVRGGGTSTG